MPGIGVENAARTLACRLRYAIQVRGCTACHSRRDLSVRRSSMAAGPPAIHFNSMAIAGTNPQSTITKQSLLQASWLEQGLFNAPDNG